MDERTLIQHAAGYLKSLYEGIDPIDKTPVGKNSIFKNEKIMRCLDYTVGVLKRISECENIVHSDYRVFFASGMKREPEVLKRAEMIMKKSGLNCRILPVPSSEYPTPARRPLNSRLSAKSLELAGIAPMPSVEDALDRYLEELRIEEI